MSNAPAHCDGSPNGEGVAPAVVVRTRTGAVGRLVRRVAGLDEDILARLEGDRRWYTGQILLVAGVATMATISMTAALTMTTGTSPWGWPLFLGTAFGSFIAICDLTIVLPDGQPHRRNPATYFGRLGFSILMGGLAAMPLTGAIFQRDVDHHEAARRQHEITAANQELDRTIAATRAAVEADHAPAIARAIDARDAARQLAEDTRAAEATQRAQCNNEITGTAGSRIPGEGSRSSALCTAANQLTARADDAQRRAEAADTDLAATLRTAKEDADTKVAALPRPTITPYQPTDIGVIDRITRTHFLLGTPATIAITLALTSLALTSLDTLPIILKLTHHSTAYERILKRHQAIETTRVLHQLVGAGGRSQHRATTAEHHLIAAIDADEEELLGGEPLEAFLRARLMIDPTITAKTLYREAQFRGYDRSYPTFTRLVRKRGLRSAATADGA
jgi:hypothetical protein